MKNIVFAVVAVLLVVAGSIFFMNMSYDNQEIVKKEQFEAGKKSLENTFDTMWKILQQKAGVTNEYKETFTKVYPEIIAGRYSQGDGSLMKMITEANPDFDTSLYKDLMQSIESERKMFMNKQDEVIDIQREYNQFIRQSPITWFMDSDVKPLNFVVISSTRSKQTMETGVDDDVDLFKK